MFFIRERNPLKIFILFFLCLVLTNCGTSKNEKENFPQTANFSKATSSTNNTSDDSDTSTSSETEKTSEKNDDSSATAPETYIEESSFQADEDIYNDNVYSIKTLGLKEYSSLRSKGYDTQKKIGYMDKPEQGKKYLVLFLSIKNTADEDVYFHPDYLSAKVDGTKIQNTFLYNDPENYKSIFKTIKANDYDEGFIVWEVPKDWKKLVMTYKGFELLGGKRLKLTITPQDLKDPGTPSKMAE